LNINNVEVVWVQHEFGSYGRPLDLKYASKGIGRLDGSSLETGRDR
jgi:hypothetical protein